jgi:hypothetical protein
MRPRPSKGKSGKISLVNQTAAAVALFAIVVLMWLSADPGAHERFHPSAGQEDHHCVVTEFVIGGAYFIAPCIVREPDTLSFGRIACEAVECLPGQVDYRLLPICGPPQAA